MKRVLVLLFLAFHLHGFSQTTISDILENTLAGVITVGVYETTIEKQQLGFRGESQISQKAYERALDLGENNGGSGSGFVIQQNGIYYIITNAHVVEYAADEPGSILVYSIDRTSYKAKLLGGDSFYDIAVLTFIDKPGPEIVPIEFKKTTSRIGERVYAIGNPLGEFPYSVSDGIISAKNRARNGITGKYGFLQTTATVFYGNSGGPLVDSEGKVAGINTQIKWAWTGEWVWQPQINFALEGELVQRLVGEIIQNNGKVIRAYLGINFTEDHEFIEDEDGNGWYKKKDELPKITKVIAYSPAAKTLSNKIGYSVETVNGESIRNIEELLGNLESVKPKHTIVLGIIKDGKKESINILAEELGTRQLENIAKAALSDDPSLKFEIGQTTTTLIVDAAKLQDASADSVADETQGKRRYLVVAGGFIEEPENQIYTINSFRDLGAVIKLTGLSGVLDFYLIREKDESERLKLYPYQYSQNENIQRKTLFY